MADGVAAKHQYLLISAMLVALLGSTDILLAQEDDKFAALRREMLDIVEFEALLAARSYDVKTLDPKVRDAMEQVPRHIFVPEALRDYAYSRSPLPVGHKQNIASPFIVALMTQLAEVEKHHIVYETGTGAGYHAAVLSLLVRRVYSVEVIGPLARTAKDKLQQLGYANVRSKHDDGYYGWIEHAPFDAIIVKEAVDHIPKPLLQQLKPGGRMVIPLGPPSGPQFLTVIEKRDDGSLKETPVLPVLFSTFQGGART